MFDEPGVQYAIWDTVENRIVRKIDYIEAFDWTKDYEAGNSRFCVLERTVPKWSIFHTANWRQREGR